MDIMWHGQSCFTIKGKKGIVVTNPYADDGIKNEKLKADLILVSDMAPVFGEEKGAKKLLPVAGTDADSKPKICDVPGEYEVSEIPVTGTQFPEQKKTIFQFRVDDMSICFLGNVDQAIPAEMIEKIGDIDILMIPDGGVGCLDAKKAQSVIEEIEPRMVVPMSYDENEGQLTAFLKNTGVTPEAKETFSMVKANLPQDKIEYVVLNIR